MDSIRIAKEWKSEQEYYLYIQRRSATGENEPEEIKQHRKQLYSEKEGDDSFEYISSATVDHSTTLLLDAHVCYSNDITLCETIIPDSKPSSLSTITDSSDGDNAPPPDNESASLDGLPTIDAFFSNVTGLPPLDPLFPSVNELPSQDPLFPIPDELPALTPSVLNEALPSVPNSNKRKRIDTEDVTSIDLPSKIRRIVDEYHWLGKLNSSSFAFNKAKLKKIKDIGEGAFGKVALFEVSSDTHPPTPMVLKWSTYKRENWRNEEVSHEFTFKEIALLAHLKHNNIVQSFGLFKYDGVPCLAMPQYKQSLNQAILDPDPFTLRQNVEMSLKLFLGIGFLHRKKIIHSDISPRNILISYDNNLVLCDFGMANTVENAVILSEDCKYMPPEMNPPENIQANYQTDCWLTGITLLQLFQKKLRGQFWFSKSTVVQSFGGCSIPYALKIIPDDEKIGLARSWELQRMVPFKYAICPGHRGVNEAIFKHVILKLQADEPSERPSIEDAYQTLKSIEENYRHLM